ncbi:MAG: sll0787 family AIR synthase-like protein [Anaerolineae bacterium]|nr:sll0787 family AIR synthase-like protein [Anaerolineae bacterium]
MPELSLEELIAALRAAPAWQRKREIEVLAGELLASTPLIEGRPVLVGDDAAAIDTGEDYLLLAAEVMYPPLVRADPYLAGKYAILANVNDIYAMGGTPLALVNMILATDTEEAAAILRGLRDGCARYGLALVGGHLTAAGDTTSVAACILGRAKKLLSSFEVQPGDLLLHATNLRGQFHPQFRFWNCSAHLSDADLRRDLALLPAIAEAGWCRAGRDVSMGGIFGSILMLLELSGVGAVVDLDAVPQPAEIEDRYPLRDAKCYLDWLLAFPSYGFILAAPPEHVAAVQAAFAAREITCATIGQTTVSRQVVLRQHRREAILWDLAAEPFIGFSLPST